MHDYDDVRFMYVAISLVRLADSPKRLDMMLLSRSRMRLKARMTTSITGRSPRMVRLLNLNGGRTLSNTRLSYLILSQPTSPVILTPPRTPSPSRAGNSDQAILEAPELESSEYQYDLLICAMHFLGDGMALHQFANDFFSLLGSEKSDAALNLLLAEEWRHRWGSQGSHTSDTNVLPSSLESNLPALPSASARLREAAAEVDFQLSQSSLVGGQTLPRRKDPIRQTIVPTTSFPEARTKAMLKKCKDRGVSISAALFAVCNLAWARVGGGKPELPAMMYSALNLRPYLTKKSDTEKLLWNSYWFLAIGYFNVILPNFLPASDQERTFWHRAREAKAQSAKAAKSKLVVSRTRQMAKERGERARMWAKEDDEKEKGSWLPLTPPTSPIASSESPAPSIRNILPERNATPSSALLGLSLLGNMDGIYKHATFPDLKLHTLTTGSRQRHGAILLFGYTFKGRLWVSLGYDQNGFKEGVIESYWCEIERCVEEFLG